VFHNFHIPRISPCVTPKYITKIPFITLHEIHFRKSIALKSKGCPPTLTIIKINTSSKETYFSVKIVDSHLKSPLEYCKRKKKKMTYGKNKVSVLQMPGSSKHASSVIYQLVSDQNTYQTALYFFSKPK